MHSKMVSATTILILCITISIGNITSNLYAAEPQFNIPSSVETDPSGRVFVTDTGNNRIQKFSSTGTFIRKWGTFGTQNGHFDEPVGVAVGSSGNVFVVDGNNNRIQKFSSTGTFIRKWGSSGIGDGQFKFPLDDAVDKSGNVFVADTSNNRIQKFSSTGTFIRKWGTLGSMSISLNTGNLQNSNLAAQLDPFN